MHLKNCGLVGLVLFSFSSLCAMPPKLFEKALIEAHNKQRLVNLKKNIDLALTRKNFDESVQFLTEIDFFNDFFLNFPEDELKKNLMSQFSTYKNRILELWSFSQDCLQKNSEDAVGLFIQKLLRFAYSIYQGKFSYGDDLANIPPFAILYGVTLSKVPVESIQSVLEDLTHEQNLKRVVLHTTPKDVGKIQALKALVQGMPFEEVLLNGIYLKRKGQE